MILNDRDYVDYIKYNVIKLKVCLTQRGMLPLKDVNMIVSSDGVGYKSWQSQCDRWHKILLNKSQDA